MSKKNKLIPELRFPKFRKNGEWVDKTVGEVYDFKVTNSFSREYLNYEKGKVKNIHYGDIHTKFNTLFDITKEYLPFINQDISIEKIKKESYCSEGDMVFADASEDLNDVGKSIEIVNLNNEKLVSGLHTLLARQGEKKLAIGFGGYLFKSDWIRRQIQREAQGAKVLGISATRISNVQISYPKSPKEQQKIASCLSSLDEVITAHSQKLESLKDHKKGLMQNLFPKDGEKVPKYRFKEFKNEGEWKIIKLKQFGTFYRGLTYSAADTASKGLLVLRSGNIQNDTLVLNKDLVFVEKECPDDLKLLKGDIVICMSNGSKALVGKNAEYQGDYDGNITVGAFCSIMRPKNKFTKYLLESDVYQSFIALSIGGGNINNLKNSDLEEFKCSAPINPKEQQKIASCLSSLDELITAQTEKIEQLREYKKGLMQGLFPKIND